MTKRSAIGGHCAGLPVANLLKTLPEAATVSGLWCKGQHHVHPHCFRFTWVMFRKVLSCAANGIDHRLTKPDHPWTNGQVGRMNRTIKDATVKRFHDDNHEQLQGHLKSDLPEAGRNTSP
jgi:hypothetical protein